MKLHFLLKKLGLIVSLLVSNFSSISQTVTPVKQDYAVGKATEVKRQKLTIRDKNLAGFVLQFPLAKPNQSYERTRFVFYIDTTFVAEVIKKDANGKVIKSQGQPKKNDPEASAGWKKIGIIVPINFPLGKIEFAVVKLFNRKKADEGKPIKVEEFVKEGQLVKIVFIG